jgi:hypothetical protein
MRRTGSKVTAHRRRLRLRTRLGALLVLAGCTVAACGDGPASQEAASDQNASEKEIPWDSVRAVPSPIGVLAVGGSEKTYVESDDGAAIDYYALSNTYWIDDGKSIEVQTLPVAEGMAFRALEGVATDDTAYMVGLRCPSVATSVPGCSSSDTQLALMEGSPVSGQWRAVDTPEPIRSVSGPAQLLLLGGDLYLASATATSPNADNIVAGTPWVLYHRDSSDGWTAEPSPPPISGLLAAIRPQLCATADALVAVTASDKSSELWTWTSGSTEWTKAVDLPSRGGFGPPIVSCESVNVWVGIPAANGTDLIVARTAGGEVTDTRDVASVETTIDTTRLASTPEATVVDTGSKATLFRDSGGEQIPVTYPGGEQTTQLYGQGSSILRMWAGGAEEIDGRTGRVTKAA